MKKGLIVLTFLLVVVFVFASCNSAPAVDDASVTTTANSTTSTDADDEITTQPTVTVEDDTQAPTSNVDEPTLNNNTVTTTTKSLQSTTIVTATTTKSVTTTTKNNTNNTTVPKKTIALESDVMYFNNTRYKLTFFDDFNGTELDRKKWEICPEWERHNGNVWRKDMVSLDGNGNLVLSCAKLQGSVYKSGAVRSRDRFDQTYGYFEARCELQKSTGFWGAFWLMPYNIDTGVKGGSDGTEIDIFESAYYHSERINHAIHWDGYGSDHKSIGTNIHVPGIHTGYHTFALEWTKDAYRFYIDGKQTYQITSAQADICDVPTYLKLTVEAGTWAGQCEDSKLPDGIKVDYVKVYKPY